MTCRYALAAGGWIWAGVNAVFFTWDFAARSVPKMEEYCELHVCKVVTFPNDGCANYDPF